MMFSGIELGLGSFQLISVFLYNIIFFPYLFIYNDIVQNSTK